LGARTLRRASEPIARLNDENLLRARLLRRSVETSIVAAESRAAPSSGPEITR
jgi:hypothetical protein